MTGSLRLIDPEKRKVGSLTVERGPNKVFTASNGDTVHAVDGFFEIPQTIWELMQGDDDSSLSQNNNSGSLQNVVNALNETSLYSLLQNPLPRMEPPLSHLN